MTDDLVTPELIEWFLREAARDWLKLDSYDYNDPANGGGGSAGNPFLVMAERAFFAALKEAGE